MQSVSNKKLIREMDASEIIAYLTANDVEDEVYIEAMNQYMQLTGERLPHSDLQH